MPGQTMKFSIQDYPQFQEKQPGDMVSFEIRGRISDINDTEATIETSDFRMTGENPAQNEMRKMMGGQKPGAAASNIEEEDD